MAGGEMLTQRRKKGDEERALCAHPPPQPPLDHKRRHSCRGADIPPADRCNLTVKGRATPPPLGPETGPAARGEVDEVDKVNK
ncbi:hypothetical protein MYCTH_2130846 [Thermothelomyces thermophilus ATCC 42464]|uniref:Uncharacterized protein n=1 Tax=Thermothelomyces thermophilus (strain ATCC 42464 / BCRC 31852 / DSM 1799) TaxID=573729 RepID=G2QQ14_THET4|nr:uncharacterized protein MYCTH_2130846 [Thermothelomyces thermophilus ATCC 42464]AEO61677.1 hypothetical protein MYCTH_2130846 [Thermothelomyces thermophilus ATCC 42464]